MAVTFAALIGVFPAISPGYILGVRSDTAEVDLFQNLAQGTINYCQYTTRAITLPDERKFRPIRIYVKGEGTVTNGTVIATFDGDLTETYTATACYNDPVADVLMQQQLLGTKTAREFFVSVTIGGTNLILREILVDVVPVEG